MKPASRNVSYIVYPPNYVPLDSWYLYASTIKEARRVALKLGRGAEIWREVRASNKRRSSSSFFCIWEVK